MKIQVQGKVQIFWEGNKIFEKKKLPISLTLRRNAKEDWDIFSKLAFPEYLTFNKNYNSKTILTHYAQDRESSAILTEIDLYLLILYRKRFHNAFLLKSWRFHFTPQNHIKKFLFLVISILTNHFYLISGKTI